MVKPPVEKSIKDKLLGRNFLTFSDFTQAEIMHLVQLSIELKTKQKLGIPHRLLEGKTLAMIFEKTSTRTRVSFEAGMFQLGGHALYLNKGDMQLGRGESLADTAKVLSSYVDVIVMRTFDHSIIVEIADNSTVPVINGLTDQYHPCQVLADLVTIYEEKGSFDGQKLAYVGDGNNMAHSLLLACATMGIDCSIGVPEGYEVNSEILERAKAIAKESGAVIEQTYDPKQAVENADFVYTDVWTSMGWEAEEADRTEVFADYQINKELVKHAKADYLFFHCLPAERGKEVTAEVIDGPHSVVFDEAENRIHAQKAILASII